ncbi:MAG TPA: STAS domain-containing protein [Anaerolineales bacterium]
MKITVTKIEHPGPIAILHLDGTLDGANNEGLNEEAQNPFADGVRDLILDLSKLVFISSAGLGALHQVAILFKGKTRPDPDESWAAYRWAAYRSMNRDHYRRLQEYVKLLSPSREVREVLDMIGFSSLFEIYTDFPQAVASFHKVAPVMETGLR